MEPMKMKMKPQRITMTLGQIRAQKPCSKGWTQLIKYLGTTDDNTIVSLRTILHNNGTEDAIWCFRVNWFEHKALYMDFVNSCVDAYAAYATATADAAYAAAYAAYATANAADATAGAAAYAAYATAAAYAAYATAGDADADADAAADAIAYAAADADAAVYSANAANAASAVAVAAAAATDTAHSRLKEEMRQFQYLNSLLLY
jgi:hypothetical protein